MIYDLIIIGAGPAGLTAGIYAGRYRLNTLILEKVAAGGQILLSPTIENFPGFPGGISTEELIQRFKKQVEESGVGIEAREALGVSAADAAFSIKTQDKSYEAKSIIIATGAQSKRLGVKGEDRLIGRGVSYCATCDGPLFRNKDVAVIGGGDRALEEAIFLSGYARAVYLVHRRQELRASGILVEKAKAIAKINFILDSVVEEVQGEDKVGQLLLKNARTGSRTKLPCQGAFIFVGINPDTAFLKNLLEMDEAGFIMTDQAMKSSRDGIFACGDCRKKSLYQVVNACAEAAVAADSAHKYLLNR